jgi:hypothetical protein
MWYRHMVSVFSSTSQSLQFFQNCNGLHSVLMAISGRKR